MPLKFSDLTQSRRFQDLSLEGKKTAAIRFYDTIVKTDPKFIGADPEIQRLVTNRFQDRFEEQGFFLGFDSVKRELFRVGAGREAEVLGLPIPPRGVVPELRAAPPPGVIESTLRGFKEFLPSFRRAGADLTQSLLGTLPRIAGIVTGIESIKEFGIEIEKGIERIKQDQVIFERKTLPAPTVSEGGFSAILNPQNIIEGVGSIIPSVLFAIITGGTTKALTSTALANSPRLATAVTFTGAGLGPGSLEGASSFREVKELEGSDTQAVTTAVAMTAASTVLNALSFATLFGKVPGLDKINRVAIASFTEAITEYLEEPTDAGLLLIQGLIDKNEFVRRVADGAQVIIPSAIIGAGGQVVVSKLQRDQLSQQIQRETGVPKEQADFVAKEVIKNADELNITKDEKIAQGRKKATEEIKTKPVEEEIAPEPVAVPEEVPTPPPVTPVAEEVPAPPPVAPAAVPVTEAEEVETVIGERTEVTEKPVETKVEEAERLAREAKAPIIQTINLGTVPLADQAKAKRFITRFARQVPEFSTSPVFTVAISKEVKGQKRLRFRDDFRFDVRPELFGIDPETINVGQKIDVDLESFRKPKAPFTNIGLVKKQLLGGNMVIGGPISDDLARRRDTEAAQKEIPKFINEVKDKNFITPERRLTFRDKEGNENDTVKVGETFIPISSALFLHRNASQSIRFKEFSEGVVAFHGDTPVSLISPAVVEGMDQIGDRPFTPPKPKKTSPLESLVVAPPPPPVAPPVTPRPPVVKKRPPKPPKLPEVIPIESRPIQQKPRIPVSEQPIPLRPPERAPSTEPEGQPEATESAPEKRISDIDTGRLNEAFTKYGPKAKTVEPTEPESTSESGKIEADLLIKPLGFPKRAIDSVLYVGDRAVVTTVKGLGKLTRSLVRQVENFIPGIKSFNILTRDLMKSAIETSRRLLDPIIGNREFVQRIAELRASKRVAQLEAKQSLKEMSVNKEGKRLTDSQQELLTSWFTGETSDQDIIRDIGLDTFRAALRYRELIDSNNRGLQQRGIISDVTYGEYANKWLPRIYREKEFLAANEFLEISREVPRVTLKRIRFRRDKWVVLFRKRFARNQIRKFDTESQAKEFESELRKDPKNIGIKVFSPITKARRKALGEVRDPALLVARALMVQEGLIANYDFLDEVSKNPDFASDKQENGFSPNPIPKIRAYGNLAGKFVHQSIRGDIVKAFNPESTNNILSAVAAFHDVTLSQWKFGKTVLNPSTQMRNIYGNFMFMELDDLSALIPENLKYFGRAAKVLRADPGTSEWEMKKFLIRERLINEDAISFELGALMSEVEKAPGVTFKDKLNNYITKRLDKLKKGRVLEVLPLSEGAATIYRMVDIVPKVASFMRNIEQGMAPEAAALKVRQNYPTYDTAITAKAVRSGARFFIPPFLTFTVESARILARHAIEKPFTMAVFWVLMRTMTDISREMLNITKEEWARILRNTPEWRRTGFTTLLTPFRDENGDLTVFDLTYVIPLGVEISALENMFRTGKVVLGGADRVFNAPMNPFLGIGIQLISNRNLFTGQDIRQSTRSEAENMREQMRFIAGQIFPSIFPFGFSFRKIAQSIQRAPITRKGERRRSIPLTAADVLAGIKIIPFSPTVDQRNKLKRIERGIDDKLRGITGLARLPERFRGMTERQRRQQMDELIADIIVLVKAYALSSGLKTPEGFDDLPLKLRVRILRSEIGIPARPTIPGMRIGLPVIPELQVRKEER